jgi:hypothetical protein
MAQLFSNLHFSSFLLPSVWRGDGHRDAPMGDEKTFSNGLHIFNQNFEINTKSEKKEKHRIWGQRHIMGLLANKLNEIESKPVCRW